MDMPFIFGGLELGGIAFLLAGYILWKFVIEPIFRIRPPKRKPTTPKKQTYYTRKDIER